MSTLEMTAHDAGFALLIDETEYSYLVTSSNEPFSYFLNPAVYGSGAAFARYDAAGESWILEDQADLQYLDDRYGTGANYLTELYGRQPFGSSLPGVFVPLDSNDELVDIRTDVANLRLTKAFTSAKVVPYLVLKVYEQRLASYDYYTWLGSPLGDGTSGTWDVADDDADENTAGTQIIWEIDKETLMETLAEQLAVQLQSGGDLYSAYETFTGLQIAVSYDAASRTFDVSNMAQYDGVEVIGERFGEITTGNMMRPNIVLPGLTKVVGHEYRGFKPMRGVYTVFAPEKLNDLRQIIENTLDTLNGIETISAADRETLTSQLGYHWYDFWRGQDQEIALEVPQYLAPRTTAASNANASATSLVVADASFFPEDSGTIVVGGTEHVYTAVNRSTNTLTIEGPAPLGTGGGLAASVTAGDQVLQMYRNVRANVFLSAFGSQLVGATVTIEDPASPGEFIEIANSQGINLSDSFSHVDETFHRSQPASQQYTTGPYGARGIVNDDGTITWLSDSYSV